MVREMLRDLQAIRLEALGPPQSGEASESRQPSTFDSSDGLSSEEAVAVSLLLNPEMRAFRRERGVAEGEIVEARVLPNPELAVTWLKIEDFTKNLATSGLNLELGWFPPRPGERSAKIARAQARLGEVRARIAAEEWRLASRVREAHATREAVEERHRLIQASIKTQIRLRTFVRERQELGDASRLDVNLVDIAYAETLREREEILNEREKARLEFNRLLGLPPLSDVTIEASPDGLAYRSMPLELSTLDVFMVETRPDLEAARQEYQQAEETLRLAYLRRWPWPRLGPAYEQDGSEAEGLIKKFGVAFGIELPFLNLGQGQIAALEARRDVLRASFTARLHEARAEIHEAYREMKAQERLIGLYQDSTEPALNENAELTEAGFEMGEFDLVRLITTQDKVLRSRRQFLEAKLAYWSAVFELEGALGSSLTQRGPEKSGE